MKLATWNVNSIKARLERLTAWLARHEPDVLCLQELKVEEKAFPREEIAALGYDYAAVCQRTYNGVAILSRWPISDVTSGIDDGHEDPQARLIAATVAGVRVLSAYFPNGERIGSDKWDYKLEWMTRLRAHLDARYHPDQPLALCGDFNVAPDERDVHDVRAWTGTTLFHPDVRDRLRRIQDFGLVDVMRKHHEEPGIYSWWDYRMLGFPKNNGLRIDHVFATAPLAAKSLECVVDREERKGKLPSDHAPVVATFDWPLPKERAKVPRDGAAAADPAPAAGQGSLFR
ncbi:MAG TPA: exodeoxyribonuclease III [bacterium]|nr:exodeoxyribonuclease III [bacterium]